jgi:hypothetical protein
VKLDAHPAVFQRRPKHGPPDVTDESTGVFRRRNRHAKQKPFSTANKTLLLLGMAVEKKFNPSGYKRCLAWLNL